MARSPDLELNSIASEPVQSVSFFGPGEALEVSPELEAERVWSRVHRRQNAAYRGAESGPCFATPSCRLATHRMGVVVSDGPPGLSAG
jgi:hypothetical protein